jgi:hypothetical protein
MRIETRSFSPGALLRVCHRGTTVLDISMDRRSATQTNKGEGYRRLEHGDLLIYVRLMAPSAPRWCFVLSSQGQGYVDSEHVEEVT